MSRNIFKMMTQMTKYIFMLSFIFCGGAHSEVNLIQRTPTYNKVLVSKCCRQTEIYIGRYCIPVNNTSQWHPFFTTEQGIPNQQVDYEIIVGTPNCGHTQLWSIYHYQNSTDKLRLLPSGILRHYFDNRGPEIPNEYEEEFDFANNPPMPEQNNFFHDYRPGEYCLDRKIDGVQSEFAWVCAPESKQMWTTNEFLMHNIVNPITHGITITFLVIVAIIYFIMPTLRDLTGNIVTTICVCLIINQTADMIRILTVFKSHISLLVTESVCYFSLLGAFFWLNSLGYYIWKTFRTRNVFLRITDGKKYCYYGGYAWSCTVILGALAMFAHFTMDYPEFRPTASFDQQQEQIGSLAMIIFFVPVAFTILADVFFLATTLSKLNRMHTYGRIHHKLRHSFRMFILLMLTMTVCWLFFLSSFSKVEGLLNSHIIVNTFLGAFVFYICVFNQKHVAYLLRKTCCYQHCLCDCCRPEPEAEWGDEMTAMNTVINY